MILVKWYASVTRKENISCYRNLNYEMIISATNFNIVSNNAVLINIINMFQ